MSIARVIKPGRVADYEAVVVDRSQAASQIPGYLGRDIFRPEEGGSPGNREYHVVLRFVDESGLRAWEASPERAALLARADTLTQGQARSERVDGMDGWFSLPEHEHKPKPPKTQSTTMTVLRVFILLCVVAPVIRHFTGSWPTPLANALSRVSSGCSSATS